MLFRDSAMFMILTTYSIWLSAEPWEMDAGESGTLSLVMAGGELLSVFCMALFSDRIGLTTNQIFVNYGGVLACLGLAFFQSSNLVVAIGFLGLGAFFFEWAALTSIALTGGGYGIEVRIQMISVMLMCMAVARSVGAVAADSVFKALGFGGMCCVAAGMQFVGASIFWATRKEGGSGWEERKAKVRGAGFELLTTRV